MICPVCYDEHFVEWVVNFKTIKTVKVPCTFCRGQVLAEYVPPMKKTVYYAHCMAIYGTKQEQRDIQLLAALGFDVVNPSHPEIVKSYEEWLEENKVLIRNTPEMKMEFWTELVKEQNVLAFRALPHGKIPSGVVKEIAVAQAEGMPVFELPSMLNSRAMSVEETREYLYDIGQR